MSHWFSFIVLGIASAGAGGPESENPLYRELRTKGVAIGETKIPLPAPMLADGLDARGQKAAITSAAGDRFSVEDLLRPSVVAPQVLRFRDVGPADAESPAHGLDLAFIAYGDLDVLRDKDFLEHWRGSDEDSEVHILTREELAERKIEASSDSQRVERFSHAVVSVLDRVQVRGTSRTIMTRSPESIVFASQLDPRFAGDRAFPNQWRSMEKEDHQAKLGPPHPYAGSGAYAKVTRLAEPRGALFVEFHMVFNEPKGWFSGHNLLRSKLPILVQSEVRSFRRELAKASRSR